MRLRRRIEIPLYRLLKPLSKDPSERRQLPGQVQASVPELHPRRAIIRSTVAPVIVTAALAGGVGVGVVSYVEERASDADLAAAREDRVADWHESAEWRAEHDVCMAEHQVREGGDAGIFTAMTDPKLDKCYAEQQVKVADIRAEESE